MGIVERAAGLTPVERRLYHAILRAFPARGGPPDLAWIAAEARTLGQEPAAAIAALVAKDVLQVDPATGVITAAYPFSGVPTPHRVTIAGGRTVYAMCAIDALGIPFMLGLDATVESADPVSGELVRIFIGDGVATWAPETARVVVGCAEGDGPTSAVLCPTINFFASVDTAEAYAAAHPEIEGRILEQGAAVESGRCSFGLLLTDADGASCAAACCDGR